MHNHFDVLPFSKLYLIHNLWRVENISQGYQYYFCQQGRYGNNNWWCFNLQGQLYGIRDFTEHGPANAFLHKIHQANVYSMIIRSRSSRQMHGSPRRYFCCVPSTPQFVLHISIGTLMWYWFAPNIAPSYRLLTLVTRSSTPHWAQYRRPCPCQAPSSRMNEHRWLFIVACEGPGCRSRQWANEQGRYQAVWQLWKRAPTGWCSYWEFNWEWPRSCGHREQL